MKKLFLIWLLFLWGFILTWCNDIKDWPGMERNDNEWGERITVVTEMCEDQWWTIEEWNEWWERQDVCFFDDKKKHNKNRKISKTLKNKYTKYSFWKRKSSIKWIIKRDIKINK